MSKNDKAEPMDASAPERSTGEQASNRQRVAYGLTTLMAEIHSLYPEVSVEYAEPDGRNTMLAASLDMSMLDNDDAEMLFALLDLLSEPRIESIALDPSSTGTGYIKMRSNPRIQDSRDPFGLDAALHVLSGEADEDAEYEDDALVSPPFFGGPHSTAGLIDLSAVYDPSAPALFVEGSQ